MDGARGGGLSKTFRLGEQPIQLGVYAYYNAIRPTAWPRPAVTAVQVDLHLSGSRFHQVSTLSDCPLMSAEGQSRQGGASCRSSDVRNAPSATVDPKKADLS
jgi:hypothetical protein